MSCYTNQVSCYYNPCNPCCNVFSIYWDTPISSPNDAKPTPQTSSTSSDYTQTIENTLKSISSDSQGKNIVGTKSEVQNWWADLSGNFIDNEINTIQIAFINKKGIKTGSLYFETNLRSDDATNAPNAPLAGSTSGRFQIISGAGIYLDRRGYVDYDSGNNKATFYLS